MSADIGRVSIGIAMFGPARWPAPTMSILR